MGTFARALDCTSTIRQPSLHMSSAAASRDITLVRHFLVLYSVYFKILKSFGKMDIMNSRYLYVSFTISAIVLKETEKVCSPHLNDLIKHNRTILLNIANVFLFVFSLMPCTHYIEVGMT